MLTINFSTLIVVNQYYVKVKQDQGRSIYKIQDKYLQ